MTKETARIIVEQLDNYLSHTCQDYGESDHEAMMMAIKALEIKPIGYRECSDAIMKMWMDNVLTDGEYYRIMDKLNAKWSKMNEVTE